MVSSFRGSALHSHLVSESLSFLVLPGQGNGHDRLLGERLNVTAGAALGHLPPCEFTLTNSVTRGTLIGFTPAALQRRLAVIGGDAEPGGRCRRSWSVPNSSRWMPRGSCSCSTPSSTAWR